jgi:adenosylhomocysteine nucleosidase
MSKIAIITALSGELKPLVRGWEKRGPHTWIGRIGDHECIAIAGGVGSEAAARACELAMRETGVSVLVSMGWAGALSCGLKPPTAHAVAEVIDARTGERFLTDNPAGQKLVMLDHVAGVDEKRSLARTYQAVMADMEAAVVAGVARERNLSFYCFKGISDGANDVLPDFSRFMRGDGQMRMRAFLLYVAFRPRYWSALKRLGENSKNAAIELARLVPLYLEEALKRI